MKLHSRFRAVASAVLISSVALAVPALLSAPASAGSSVFSTPNSVISPDGNGDGTYTSVSCTGPSDCTAVGISVTNQIYYVTESKGAFAGSADITSAFRGFSPAISCADSTDCTVVGVDGGSYAFEATETAGVWQPPVRLGTRSLVGISCTSPTECTAVGGEGVGATYATETAGVWGPLTTPPNAASIGFYTSVSCSAPSTCTAVGAGPGDVDGIAQSEVGGVWGAVSAIAPPGTDYGDLNSVSCVDATDCTAVGRDFDAYTPMFVDEVAGVWGAAGTISQLPNDPPYGPAATFDSVSCTGVGDCVAVGNTDNFPVWATETGGVWSSAVTDIGGSAFVGDHIAAVSCPNPIDCTAVGTDQSGLPMYSLYGAATVPSAPVLTSAVPTGSSIQASWTAPSDNGGTPILSYTATASDGTNTFTCTTGALSCEITGLSLGTSYDVTVVATNVVGDSVASNTVSAIPEASVPSAPTLTSVTSTNSTAEALWSAPSQDGGSAIVNYTATATDGSNTFTCTTGLLSCAITGLSIGTTYSVSVVATNAVGSSSPSNTLSVTPSSISAFRPSPPQLNLAVPGDSSITLAWSPPARDGGSPITGYIGSVYSNGVTSSCSVDSTISSCSIAGLIDGATYQASVRAVNLVGVSASSNIVTASLVDVFANAPTSPTLTNVAVGDGSVRLTWSTSSPGSGTAITEYVGIAQDAATSADTYCFVEAPFASTTLSCTVRGLKDSTAYVVGVVAANATSHSKVSRTETATPSATLPESPSAPVLVSAIAGDGAMGLVWLDPLNNGGDPVTGYVASVSANGVTTGCSSAITSTSCTVSGLTDATTYTVSVQAVTDVGDSTASNVIDATPSTDAPPPAGVSAAALGTPVTSNTAAGAATTIDSSIGVGSSASVSVPDGALPNGTTVSVYPVDSPSALSASLPPSNSYVASVAVSWVTPDLTSPASSAPITLTLTDSSIVAGDVIYMATSSGLTQVGIATVNGSAIVTFEVDPTLIVASSPPSAPLHLKVSTHITSLSVSWGAPSSTGGSRVTSYTATAIPGGRSCTTTRLTCTIIGLTQGTPYEVTVAAVNHAGIGQSATLLGVRPGVKDTTKFSSLRLRLTIGHENTTSLKVSVTATGSTQRTGTVTILDGTTTVCVISLTRSKGSCRLTASQLAVGVHSLIAVYSGDAKFASSQGTTTLTIRA